MLQSTWREGCPVPLADLVIVSVPHVGYDGTDHRGELIVHTRVKDDVIAIFCELHAARFPIERMQRIELYNGSDDASMAANNTSAFNCREVAGRPGRISNHSYGVAIDLNPLTNPWVSSKEVSPAGGKRYVDRTQNAPGLVKDGDFVQRAFAKRGFRWGGHWKTVKDYQHFEKPDVVNAKPTF